MRNLLQVGLLAAVALTMMGCGGGREPTKVTVPVRVEARVDQVKGDTLTASGSTRGRSVGEVVSVWLTRPVQQRLEYDPSSYTARGVVLVELGQHTFRVEAKRSDGVTLYAGETSASITVEERFKQIAVTLLPVPASVDITAVVHEITGPPAIRLTYVPPRGTYDDLRGVVENINPALVAVAVYIEVGGQWWTKPYWNRPRTPVREDGTWVCDITTGGYDQNATRIRAYLIRRDYDPPLAPQQGLPPDPPTPDVLAMVEVMRD